MLKVALFGFLFEIFVLLYSLFRTSYIAHFFLEPHAPTFNNQQLPSKTMSGVCRSRIFEFILGFGLDLTRV